ncbi:hypothetical protein XENOCAPTIV_014194, partial [Xenoophorus captivus]
LRRVLIAAQCGEEELGIRSREQRPLRAPCHRGPTLAKKDTRKRDCRCNLVFLLRTGTGVSDRLHLLSLNCIKGQQRRRLLARINHFIRDSF